MYEQYGQGDLLFMALYGAVTMLSLTACCYLLFRRANAIAPEITSPTPLRRWTGAFFASMTLSHVWYLPIVFLTSNEDILLNYIVGALLDFMLLIPLAIVILIVMLQDRRRQLWPIAVMMAPPIAALAVYIVDRSIAIFPIIYTYQLLLGICLTIYMVRATRQYGRWSTNPDSDMKENKKNTDGNYDKSLAVKCVNGTFVGQKTDHVLTYKGILFNWFINRPNIVGCSGGFFY